MSTELIYDGIYGVDYPPTHNGFSPRVFYIAGTSVVDGVAGGG